MSEVQQVHPNIAMLTRMVTKLMQTPPFEAMTFRQVCVLLHAYPDPVTIRHLNEVMGVDKPALSRIADLMEKANLMIREPDPDDRRSITLALTPSAKKAIRQLAGL